MKAYGAVQVKLLAFLTLVRDGDECSASRRGQFTLAKSKKIIHYCIHIRNDIKLHRRRSFVAVDMG